MIHLPLYMHSHLVSLSEVPDEISLTIGIYGCPFNCEDCHTPELQTMVERADASTLDTTKLDLATFKHLLDQQEGVSVVTFFGGDTNPKALIPLLSEAHSRGLKTCLYTGAKAVSKAILTHLDFYKVGQYNPTDGPLTSEKTNQVFYAKTPTGEFIDVTYKFWRKPNAN